MDLRNLQEQVKKAVCYQKLFWPFTVWINCSSDLKKFANPRPPALNFKRFSQSLEQFFLTVGQNNFGNKLPFFLYSSIHFFCSISLCSSTQDLFSIFQRDCISRLRLFYLSKPCTFDICKGNLVSPFLVLKCSRFRNHLSTRGRI